MTMIMMIVLCVLAAIGGVGIIDVIFCQGRIGVAASAFWRRLFGMTT